MAATFLAYCKINSHIFWSLFVLITHIIIGII
nr:MAG TPA: hypothetical protein [Caudoviricetes sp.]